MSVRRITIFIKINRHLILLCREGMEPKIREISILRMRVYLCLYCGLAHYRYGYAFAVGITRLKFKITFVILEDEFSAFPTLRSYPKQRYLHVRCYKNSFLSNRQLSIPLTAIANLDSLQLQLNFFVNT